MKAVRPVAMVKGKPRIVLDREDRAEIARGKRVTRAEEAREAKAEKPSRTRKGY